MEANLKNTPFRTVRLKDGLSVSHLFNNLTRSDFYVAYAKNGFLKSGIPYFQLSEIENEKIAAEDIATNKMIKWESKESECTHIAYQLVNGVWYLIAGFIGSLEVFNEDTTKQYWKQPFK